MTRKGVVLRAMPTSTMATRFVCLMRAPICASRANRAAPSPVTCSVTALSANRRPSDLSFHLERGAHPAGAELARGEVAALDEIAAGGRWGASRPSVRTRASRSSRERWATWWRWKLFAEREDLSLARLRRGELGAEVEGGRARSHA